MVVPSSLQANPASSIHMCLTLCSAPSQVKVCSSQFTNYTLSRTVSEFVPLNKNYPVPYIRRVHFWWTMINTSLCQVDADTFLLSSQETPIQFLGSEKSVLNSSDLTTTSLNTHPLHSSYLICWKLNYLHIKWWFVTCFKCKIHANVKVFQYWGSYRLFSDIYKEIVYLSLTSWVFASLQWSEKANFFREYIFCKMNIL